MGYYQVEAWGVLIQLDVSSYTLPRTWKEHGLSSPVTPKERDTWNKPKPHLQSVVNPSFPPMSLLFRHHIMSNPLWPHGLQHTRLPCPSPSPGVCLSSCPLNRWCHPTISSSVTLFSFCLQSFLASGSFPMSQVFASGDQSIGASASAWVLPKSIRGWFPLKLTGLISLLSKGLSRVFCNTTVQKHQLFGALPSLSSSSYICPWRLERP